MRSTTVNCVHSKKGSICALHGDALHEKCPWAKYPNEIPEYPCPDKVKRARPSPPPQPPKPF